MLALKLSKKRSLIVYSLLRQYIRNPTAEAAAPAAATMNKRYCVTNIIMMFSHVLFTMNCPDVLVDGR
jgi:hypothetical protein